MSDQHIILGIHITDRLKNAVDVQKVFTEYGCNIKTRIGLHDASENVCSPSGVVLIEFFGAEDEADGDEGQAEPPSRACRSRRWCSAH